MLPYCYSWFIPNSCNMNMQSCTNAFPQQIVSYNQETTYFPIHQFPTLNQNQAFSFFSIPNLNFMTQLPLNTLKTQTSLSEPSLQQQQIKTLDKNDKLKYGKKNAQSNIVNQTFSFVSLRIKNFKILKNIFKNEEKKMEIYYQFLKLWKKNNKKYINRKYIKELAQFDQNHPATKLFDRVNRSNLLSKQEFRRAFRILVNYYLQRICTNTIITSSKLDKQTMTDHLERRREVYEYFNYHMSLAGFKLRNKN